MSSSSKPGKALPFDFFRESFGNSLASDKNKRKKSNNFRPDLANLFGTFTPIQKLHEIQSFGTGSIILGPKNINFEPKIIYSKLENDSKKNDEDEIEHQLDLLLNKVLEKNPEHKKHLERLNDILAKSREIINQDKNLEKEIDPVEDFIKHRHRERA